MKKIQKIFCNIENMNVSDHWATSNSYIFWKIQKMGMMGKESPSLKKLVLHSKEDKRWSCEKLFISIFICLKLVRPAFLNQAPPYMYALNEESMTHSCKLRSLKMKVHPIDSFFSWYFLELIWVNYNFSILHAAEPALAQPNWARRPPPPAPPP